uniref:Putative secreted protein n=1 Tax=Ixodes ricinus TaxID=34613 RepID=A0A6B0UBA9_IXORI
MGMLSFAASVAVRGVRASHREHCPFARIDLQLRCHCFFLCFREQKVDSLRTPPAYRTQRTFLSRTPRRHRIRTPNSQTRKLLNWPTGAIAV